MDLGTGVVEERVVAAGVAVAAFAGLYIVLRHTQPGLKRPYRVWAYPLTPIVFLLVTGFMMYYLITQRPTQSLAGALTMLAGLVLFALSRRPVAVSGSAP